MWFGVKPRDIAQFLAKRRMAIGRYSYFIFACTLTAFYIFVLISVPIILHFFNTKWLVLSGIVLWSLLGVWLPILRRQHSWSTRSTKMINIVGRCLAAMVLIGFWLVVWPDWRTPLVVTVLAITALVAGYLVKYPQESRRVFQKAMQLVAEVKFVKREKALKDREDSDLSGNRK